MNNAASTIQRSFRHHRTLSQSSTGESRGRPLEEADLEVGDVSGASLQQRKEREEIKEARDRAEANAAAHRRWKEAQERALRTEERKVRQANAKRDAENRAAAVLQEAWRNHKKIQTVSVFCSFSVWCGVRLVLSSSSSFFPLFLLCFTLSIYICMHVFVFIVPLQRYSSLTTRAIIIQRKHERQVRKAKSNRDRVERAAVCIQRAWRGMVQLKMVCALCVFLSPIILVYRLVMLPNPSSLPLLFSFLQRRIMRRNRQVQARRKMEVTAAVLIQRRVRLFLHRLHHRISQPVVRMLFS